MSDKSRRYREKHAAKLKAAQKKWRTENPHKRKAHGAVKRALLNGKLTKPSRCELCKSAVSLHAHHADYTKPLDVQWLCGSCHSKEHGGVARGAKKVFATGESHGRVKLSEKQVREIKTRLSTTSKRGLAREYGVDEALIRQIAKGLIWKNV